jgi:hypothetical protein
MKRRVILLVPLLVLFAFVDTAEERAEAATSTWGCMGTVVKPGNDIDSIINNDRSDTPTTFCVDAGTYTVSAPAILKDGDKLIGQPGTTNPVKKCTAGTCVNTEVTQPIPVVKLQGSGTANLLRARGRNISISWVDLSRASGTGTGSGAITAGSADSTFVVQFARIHNNASLGISNMKGTVRDSEFFSNSEQQSALGFNGSAVKGITEYVAARVFVHDEQGNGLWCDVGCSDSPMAAFHVYDSVVVNNGRGGIRYENSSSKAWFENNEVHGNGRIERRGGVDIRDSQNATVKSNVFGGATFRFIDPLNKLVTVIYPPNVPPNERIGIRATDSGRSDRVNLSNVDVLDNMMNNERIVTCGGPVMCSGNTNVGTR